MSLSSSKFFQLLVASFSLGVGNYYSGNFYKWLIILIFSTLFYFAWKKTKTKAWWLLAIFFFGFVIASLPDAACKQKNSIALYYNQNKFFSAKIVDSRKSLIGQTLILQPFGYYGEFAVYEKVENEFFYGDEVKISCFLSKPSSVNVRNYYRQKQKDGILAICQKPVMEFVKASSNYSPMFLINKLKDASLSVFNKILPLPESALLSGILIGDVAELSSKETMNFSVSGITHIVAVSGYNVNLIIAFWLMLAPNLGLSRKKVFILSFVFLCFFAILTGLGSSVVRASLMSLTLLFGQTLGRKYHALNGLLFVGALMVLFNPLILFFDLGFQLSFLSTLGLISLSEKIKKIIYFIPDKFSLPENLSSTFASMIMSAPLILFCFNKFSLYAPIANILVLPLIPLIMFLGFIVLLCGFIFLPLAKVLAIVVFPFLSYVIKIAETIASLPNAALFLRLPLIFLISYYFVLFAFIFCKKKPH